VQSKWYEMRIQERLSPDRAEWFEGMEIRQEEGQTILTGPIADQAALHGLLTRVRNLNLTLLSINPAITSDCASEPPAAQQKSQGE
jgi:hypothetical protein